MRWRLIEHDTVDSTSERAFAELAAGRARHGDVHSAREQTAGRGRRGATWASARDEGLYVSAVLLPERAAHPAALTMAGGLAVFEAARDAGVRDARLKWPNDLLVGEAKLAGVLVETRGLDPARPQYVLGLGLNVRQREFPFELLAQRPVTSLAACGIELDLARARELVLGHLATRLAQAFEQAPSLCDDFARATGMVNARLELSSSDEHMFGRFEGLSLHGLVLRTDDGARRSFTLEHVRAVRVL